MKTASSWSVSKTGNHFVQVAHRYSQRYITKTMSQQLFTNEPYRLKGRIWIEGPEGTFLGFGRVVLLERIHEHGSISAAARSMEMSYRHAWKLVDSMNRQSRSPVVEKSTGGQGGGGAVLTAAGEQAIEIFKQTYADFKAFLAEQEKQL